MENKPKLTPKYFFLTIAMIAGLYVSAVSFLILVFRIIDTAFPAVGRSFYYSPSISGPVATLIVVFPLFLFFIWLLKREHAKAPEMRGHAIRKWLIYITLFLAGAAIVADLITVLYLFLDGQNITSAFLLKVLAVILVAGAIFLYYLKDVKSEHPVHWNPALASIVSLVVLAAIVAGFFVIGTPKAQREARRDSERVSGLQSIQWQVVSYYQTKGELPENLAQVEDPLSRGRLPVDPQTGLAYEYKKTGELSFELCAEFERSSRGRQIAEKPFAAPAFDSGRVIVQDDEDFAHSAGRQCFERTIDPERYPPKR